MGCSVKLESFDSSLHSVTEVCDLFKLITASYSNAVTLSCTSVLLGPSLSKIPFNLSETGWVY